MMHKNVSLVIMVIVLLAIGLVGCQKDASTPAPAIPTSPAPLPTTQPFVDVSTLAARQTAEAAGTKPAAQTTPQPTQPAGQKTAVPDQPQPTKPPVIVPTVTPGRPATYLIQQGDHYVCIARRFNLNLDEFFALNGLNMNSHDAVAGMTVKIPSGGSWSSVHGQRTLKAHPATYIVAADDTLNRIACTYGDVDPNQIAAANGLKAPYTLSIGQKLNIP